MAFISSLGFQQFRTFRRQATFEFAPLTILTGPNSSGKSSLLKALLLLQASIRTEGYRQLYDAPSFGILRDLKFDDPAHGLPAFDSALSKNADSAGSVSGFPNLSLEIEIKDALSSHIPNEPEESLKQIYRNLFQQEIAGDTSSIRGDESLNVLFRLSYDKLGLTHVALHESGDSRRELIGEIFLSSARPDPIDFATDEALHGVIPRPFVVPSPTRMRLNGTWWLRKFGPAFARLGQTLPGISPAKAYARCENILRRDLIADHERGISGVEALVWWLPEVLSAAQSTEDPAVQALADKIIKPVLLRLIQQLLANLSRLQIHRFLDGGPYGKYITDDGDLGKYISPTHGEGWVTMPLIQAWTLQHWIRFFGVGDGIHIERSGPNSVKAFVKRDDVAIPLQHIGSGHRRLLSFIFRLGAHNPWSYFPPSGGEEHIPVWMPFLIEEPEARLHPNLQSKLSDLFVDVVKPTGVSNSASGFESVLGDFKQFEIPAPPAGAESFSTPTYQLIVETHSEYLIRRLQYLVATGAASPDAIAIYYLGPNPSADDYIKRITIAPSGKLSESFGPGFTDEATNLMIDLYKQTHQN
jgi:predicted ATPase